MFKKLLEVWAENDEVSVEDLLAEYQPDSCTCTILSEGLYEADYSLKNAAPEYDFEVIDGYADLEYSQSIYRVTHIETKEECMICFWGTYDSYESIFDFWKLTEIKPVEKTITVWEELK